MAGVERKTLAAGGLLAEALVFFVGYIPPPFTCTNGAPLDFFSLMVGCVILGGIGLEHEWFFFGFMIALAILTNEYNLSESYVTVFLVIAGIGIVSDLGDILAGNIVTNFIGSAASIILGALASIFLTEFIPRD